ncbi:hypothetical protein DS745_01175 [Anaerobacillus alkaliphilus]|uniref:Uncharacterized protein n=1 Tax=Anaerobacillus alkaliphilus TaxID=1548597 RepID=A0A4Q0VZL2_9BACI|nr:hypothetical protein [Anaerobacillus alkaliphilus]RXJ04031.1 hypothetical protein DS745_01175 [Anaerobacillus alkaliphilus]
MKQWLVLSIAISAFLVVWGSVFYLFFLKQEPTIKYARDLSEVYVVSYPKESKEEELIMDKALIVFTKHQTEVNKLAVPPLTEGIDYGDGISIDDVLVNVGIALNVTKN